MIQTDKDTSRQRYKQTKIQADKDTNRQRHKQTKIQTETEKQSDKLRNKLKQRDKWDKQRYNQTNKLRQTNFSAIDFCFVYFRIFPEIP